MQTENMLTVMSAWGSWGIAPLAAQMTHGGGR